MILGMRCYSSVETCVSLTVPPIGAASALGSGGVAGTALHLKWTILGVSGVIMFFRKDPPQTEGRRNADLLIKTPPEVSECRIQGEFCPSCILHSASMLHVKSTEF